MNAEKIPATVITGFLGAGKTTLVRNLLATANGKRIALIINYLHHSAVVINYVHGSVGVINYLQVGNPRGAPLIMF